MDTLYIGVSTPPRSWRRVNGNDGIFCLLEFRFGDILRYYELSTSLLFDREGDWVLGES